MKLHYWRGTQQARNFGDEINPWLWPRYLDDVLDAESRERFVGIGTLLSHRIPPAAQTVVFGSGFGYGKPPPRIDDTWTIYCVRGPETARVLNVDPDLAVTDPAMLIRRHVSRPTRRSRVRFGYMPHWKNASSAMRAACREAEVRYIDPTASVDAVIAEILGVECLITEAMHGAIAADALRIPWIDVHDPSNPHSLGFKWRDWTATLGLTPAFHHIAPPGSADFRDFAADHVADFTPFVRSLSAACRASPMLSDERLLDERLDQLESRLAHFRRDVAAGRFDPPTTGALQSRAPASAATAVDRAAVAVGWIRRPTSGWLHDHLDEIASDAATGLPSEAIEARADRTHALGRQPLWAGYGAAEGRAWRYANAVRTARHMGELYSRLTRRLSPDCIVEIGTAFGVSGMYFLAGLNAARSGRLLTFEPNEVWAAIARDNLRALGNRFKLTVGTFEDHAERVLGNAHSPALAFVDGIHTRAAVMAQVELLLRFARPDAIVILNAIDFSPDMARGWAELARDARFVASATLGRNVGILQRG